jgi:DNA-binding NarL/FixJ family response regulator
MSIAVSVVEDDRQVREIIVDWIKRARGFRHVSDYGAGETALAKLPAEKPEVVLMDINLPKMSGIECVRRLKPLMPETQFVMLTVYEDPDHLFSALAAGASGYLLKRTSCEDLIAAIEQVHAGGSPMSNNIARKVVASFHRSAAEFNETQELTPREWMVLERLSRGDLYKEIADSLGITMPTVNTHIRNIYQKLHVQCRTMAAAKFARVTPPSGAKSP